MPGASESNLCHPLVRLLYTAIRHAETQQAFKIHVGGHQYGLHCHPDADREPT